MKLFVLRNGQPERYSVAQFRLDYPALSISDVPHEDELAAFATCDPPILIFYPLPVVLPDYDPATQILVSDPPVLLDGKWYEAWHVEDLPPAPPTPDFNQLRQGILTENGFREALMLAIETDIVEAIPIISRLDVWEQSGVWEPFFDSLLMTLGNIDSQMAAHVAWEFLALAQRTHMDPAFLAALQAALSDAQ